jgi:preprotein translocase subunit SecE
MGTAMESTASGVHTPESFLGELFSARLYKPTQGRIARQVTGGAIWVAFAIGAWRWFQTGYGFEWIAGVMQQALGREQGLAVAGWLVYLLPGLVLAFGIWFGYRLVNYSRFADFLIAVEAEMNKVTWPSQDELVRASVVVILLLMMFAALLFFFDIIWYEIFHLLGIR